MKKNIFSLLIVLFLLVACGQKGNLYLPPAPTPLSK
ncbi:MAG: lipoprotein [Cytophagales bacterium]|nr:lipoprotein [Cytophagales bacterium]